MAGVAALDHAAGLTAALRGCPFGDRV